MIRGNIHPQPSGRNSLAEEIKNSHPAPGPLMADIVHVNMGHCPYYHITFRKALATRTCRGGGREGIAYKYQQLQNGVDSPPRVLPTIEDGNSIIYSTHSGTPSRNLITAREFLSEHSFLFSTSQPHRDNLHRSRL